MNGPQTKGGRTMPVSLMFRSSVLRRVLAVSVTLALAGAGTLLVPSAQAASPSGVRLPSAAARVPSTVHAPSSVLAGDTGCTTSGGTVTCHLWAKAGTATLTPSAPTVPVWSFVSSSGDAVTAPVGPTLVVTEGQSVEMILHNEIAGQAVSLSMPQVDGFPDDVVGAATSTIATYAFTAARSGTFLYEAGGTADGARQAAMGLVGAFVVLPTSPGTAYGTPNTAYTDEAVLVLSDVDPDLNASPTTYDMRNFAPRFHLFNGVAFPATTPIPVTAGEPALLRLVNAAIVPHAIGVLGTTQSVVAESARPLTHPYGVAAENIPAGDTMDMIVSVPSSPGLKYAVYDASMRLDNDGAASSAATGNIVAFGGELIFLQASGTAPTPSSPPVVSGLSVSPTRVGTTPTTVSFTATVTDDVQVQAVEYVIDNAGTAAGSGTSVPITAATVVTLAPVSVPVDTLGTGTHQILVRGRDADGWGPLQSVSFKVDKAGPTVTGITPAAQAVNGTAALAFSGSASDNGGGSVVSATWALDGAGSTAATLSPSSGPTVALSGSVPAASIAALTDGVHYISATAVDDLGNAGPAGPAGSPVGASFVVDQTAPTTGDVVVTPSPNNGSQGVSYDPNSVEVRAPYSDAGTSPSGVVSGEGFIGTAGAVGTGFPMVIYAPTQSLVATIPLSQLTSLPNGTTTIYVRAKDKAGNWGAVSSGPLVMNRSVTVSGLTLTPSTTSTNATVALAGTATPSPGLTVLAAEYFIDTDPGAGLGAAVTVGPAGATSALSATIPVTGLSVGTHTVGVRAKDSNGTWGPVTTTTLTLTPLFADGFEAGPLPAPWSAVTTAGAGTATRTAAAALVGSFGLRVSVSGTNNRGYVTTPVTAAVPTYHARFQLNPNTLVTGTRWVTVLQALGGATGTGPQRFRVEYRRNGAGTPEVRVVVSTGNSSTTGAAQPLNAGAANTIRVDWTSAASATVTLTVNGTPTTMTGLNTNNRTVTAARLGISLAPTGGNGAYGGVVYLDAFTSARYAL